MMLDVEETTTGSRWKPRLPGRKKVTGRPGDDGDTGAAGNGKRGLRPPPVRRADGDERGTYDVRNSWQVVVGSLLIPLGVVFILLAWYGAAHARVEQQQIPYLISGGFIGLGCMVVGGLLYWGHWLYRIFDQADLHHHEQRQLMEQLIRTLGGTANSGGNGVSAGASTWAAPEPVEETGAGPGTFYATASGTVYHRAGCAVIAHHPSDLRVLGPEGLSALRPCQICDPTSSGS